MKIEKKRSIKLLEKYKKYIGKSFYDKKNEQIVKITDTYINRNDNDVMFKLSGKKGKYECNLSHFNTHIKENTIR